MKSFMCCFWFCIFIFEFPLNFAECKHNGIIWVGLCKKTLVKSKCKHDEHGVLKIYIVHFQALALFRQRMSRNNGATPKSYGEKRNINKRIIYIDPRIVCSAM